MSDHPRLESLPDIPALVTPKLKGAASICIVAGLVSFVALLATDANRAWGGFLSGLVLPAWLSMAALFFISIHH